VVVFAACLVFVADDGGRTGLVRLWGAVDGRAGSSLVLLDEAVDGRGAASDFTRSFEAAVVALFSGT